MLRIYWALRRVGSVSVSHTASLALMSATHTDTHEATSCSLKSRLPSSCTIKAGRGAASPEPATNWPLAAPVPVAGTA